MRDQELVKIRVNIITTQSASASFAYSMGEPLTDTIANYYIKPIIVVNRILLLCK